MREATKEELKGISQYIKSVSRPMGINFFDVMQKQVLPFYEGIDSKKNEIPLDKRAEEAGQKDIEPQIILLATQIDQLSYDYDPYQYHDTVEDREAQIATIAEDIRSGNMEYLQDFLNTIISDSIEDTNDSKVVQISRKAQELLEKLFVLDKSIGTELIEDSNLFNEME